MERETQKPVEYEFVEIGEAFGPVEIDIDDHFVKFLAFTVDDSRDWPNATDIASAAAQQVGRDLVAVR